MREEFEICPKQVFGPFSVTFATEWSDLTKKGAKEGVLMCQSEKIPCFDHGKIDISPHSVLFFHWVIPKICNSNSLKNYCFKYFVASKH